MVIIGKTLFLGCALCGRLPVPSSFSLGRYESLVILIERAFSCFLPTLTAVVVGGHVAAGNSGPGEVCKFYQLVCRRATTYFSVNEESVTLISPVPVARQDERLGIPRVNRREHAEPCVGRCRIVFVVSERDIVQFKRREVCRAPLLHKGSLAFAREADRPRRECGQGAV